MLVHKLKTVIETHIEDDKLKEFFIATEENELLN